MEKNEMVEKNKKRGRGERKGNEIIERDVLAFARKKKHQFQSGRLFSGANAIKKVQRIVPQKEIAI